MQWNSADSFLFDACRVSGHGLSDADNELWRRCATCEHSFHNDDVQLHCYTFIIVIFFCSWSHSFVFHIVGPFYSFSSLVHGRRKKNFRHQKKQHHNFSLVQLLVWSKFMICFFFSCIRVSDFCSALVCPQRKMKLIRHCRFRWRWRWQRWTTSECGYEANVNCNCKSLRECCGLHINNVWKKIAMLL